MAVEAKIVDIDDKMNPCVKNTGNPKLTINKVVSIAAADDDTSVYYFAQVPAYAIVNSIDITNTAVTGGTDYDIGLFTRSIATGEFTAVDADLFADGVDMSSARAEGSAASGKAEIGVADRVKTVYELAAATLPVVPATYWLGLTANTVGTAAGSIGIDVNYTVLNA